MSRIFSAKNIRRELISLFSLVAILLAQSAANGQMANVKASLNGIDFVFDGETGSILNISHAATGDIIHTTRDSSGLVDLAYPVENFEALRLASRFSKNAKITTGKGMVTIHWDELGKSRSGIAIEGKVSVTVTIKEEPDNQSVNISCKVKNNSRRSIPQIIFPDFFGIIPFCGTEGTRFRTGGTSIKPFVDLQIKEHETFYGMYENSRWFHYGFVLNGKNLVIKWMDIGGKKGGVSLFAKNWGRNKGYDEGVYLKLSELTGNLRFMHTIYENIEPGAEWQSAEFIITPHKYDWAQGIIPYRKYANENIKRHYPMPDHIRDGLGYRTIWQRNFFYPEDAEGNNFLFKDFPKVAREAKEHGLDELVTWGWNEPFRLPLPPVIPYLGTEKDLIDAVEECKKIGVNVSLFRSVMISGPKAAFKYGLTPNTEYNYDPEFLPLLNPRFAKALKGSVMVPTANPLWQQETLSSAKHLIDIGIPSACWDQYFNTGPGDYLDTVMIKILKMAKARDPQSTISAEVGTNMEKECDMLDYSWNWDYNDGCDYRATLSSLKGPRINLNIDRSDAEVKYGFADNLYLNVFSRKKGGVNGSGYISEHPKVSAALKQCARLRKQFLNYFVNGTFLADCVIAEDIADIHASSYVTGKKMLLIVINKGSKRTIRFQSYLDPWLKSGSGRYTVKQYIDGRLIKTSSLTSPEWKQQTPAMNNLDICLYEVIAE